MAFRFGKGKQADAGDLEVVPAGRITRIYFDEEIPIEVPDEPEEDDTFEPEPVYVPEPRRELGLEALVTRHHRPRHRAPIEEIEYEIDHLQTIRGGRTPPGVPVGRDDLRAHEKELYRTSRGRVTSVRDPNGRTVIYTEGGSYRDRRRFQSRDVDPIVHGVRLDEVVEEVVETDTLASTAEGLGGGTGLEAYDGDQADETPYYDYKGDIHPVIELEGIGPTYAKKLEAAGIKTTARLSYETPERISELVGAPTTTVESWQAMAEFAKVKGIGPQYAEALARAGIAGVGELKQRSAKVIAKQVNEYLDSRKTNVLGSSITEKRVEGWKKAAKPMRKVRQTPPEE